MVTPAASEKKPFGACDEDSAPRSVFLVSGLRSLENLLPVISDRLDTELFDQELKEFFNRYASGGQVNLPEVVHPGDRAYVETQRC